VNVRIKAAVVLLMTTMKMTFEWFHKMYKEIRILNLHAAVYCVYRVSTEFFLNRKEDMNISCIRLQLNLLIFYHIRMNVRDQIKIQIKGCVRKSTTETFTFV